MKAFEPSKRKTPPTQMPVELENITLSLVVERKNRARGSGPYGVPTPGPRGAALDEDPEMENRLCIVTILSQLPTPARHQCMYLGGPCRTIFLTSEI